jgi:CheY-like chemotaxis protein
VAYTILLVEDDESVRCVLQRIIERQGHTVVPTNNGKVALRALENQRFDLIITDICMPEMDGIELVRTLRRMSERPRVIAISGGRGSATSYLAMALTFGAEATLAKPVSGNELIDEIDRVMSGG